MREPFNLLAGPLARMELWVVDEQQHMLLANIHHSITDGWSSALLQRELLAAYAACVAGSKPQWEPLPIQVRLCFLHGTCLWTPESAQAVLK
jgi:Condensation domain